MLELLILPPFDGQAVMQDERSFWVGKFMLSAANWIVAVCIVFGKRENALCKFLQRRHRIVPFQLNRAVPHSFEYHA